MAVPPHTIRGPLDTDGTVSYRSFLVDNWRFVGFGLLATALSGFGQTFYIALFGADLRETFHLTHGEYGLLYSAATLASGVSIVWMGRLVDFVDLRPFAGLSVIGLASGCVLMAAAESAALVGVAMFVLRLTGQGLLTHTAATTMGRYFEAGRGKAVAIAAKGLPLAEATMPPLGVALIAALGWRGTWWLSAAVLGGLFLPLLLWLLKGHGERHRRHIARLASQEAAGHGTASPDWTQGEALQDLRFYLLLPAVLAGPLIVTGMFFHQAHLAESKGWTLDWLAHSFLGFAAAHVASLLYFGPAVDRLGVLPVLRVFLLPMALGLLIVAFLDDPWAAWGYMALMGLSIGGTGTLLGALWPALYGTAHLGAIRSVVHAAMVFVTAISPVAVGTLIDVGISMESVAVGLAAYILAATALAAAALRLPTTRH